MGVFEKLKKFTVDELKDEGRRHLKEKVTTLVEGNEYVSQNLSKERMAEPTLEIEEKVHRIELALSMLAVRSLSTPEDIQSFERILHGETLLSKRLKEQQQTHPNNGP